MQKRTLLLGTYNTADHGWTLTGYKLTDPEQKTNYMEKPSGDGSWDLSTVLTDGVPRYKARTLTATLECSEGTRSDRKTLISEMVNGLDGFEMKLVLPDHPDRYITGRVHVAEDYNDLAHAAVTVTADCASPWLYASAEKTYTLTASADPQTAVITNEGRLVLVPQITVSGTDADVLLEYGASSISTRAGTYEWPMLVLTPGTHELSYRGKGKVVIKFREAVLR